jgi:hypothetical protein
MLLWRQFETRPEVPTLADVVDHIIPSRPKKEMLRIAAPFVIAGMAHVYPVRDFGSKGVIRNPVSVHRLAHPLHLAVAIPADVQLPFPAASGVNRNACLDTRLR